MNEQKDSILRSDNSRYRRKKLFSALAVILLAVILIAANLLSGLLPWKLRSPSLTDDPVFGLSSSTKTLLNTLDEDVTLYLLCENGTLGADRDLLSFLKNYEVLSPRISVKVIDTLNDSDFLASHGMEGISEGSVFFVVESDLRYVPLSLYDLYYYYHKSDEQEFYLSPSEYVTSGEQLATMGYKVTPYFNGEAGITNAIRTVVTQDVPTVAILQSAYLSEDGSLVSLNAEINSVLLQSIRQSGCDVRYLASVSEIAQSDDLLIFNSPLIDLSDTEAANLSAWLKQGGDMLLTTYFGNSIDQPNLAALLESYGMSADEKQIKLHEGNSSYTQGSYHVAMVGTHEISSSLTESVVVSDAHAIYISPRDDVSHTRLLYTTSLGSRQKYNSSTLKYEAIDEDPSAYTYGVVAEKQDSRIVWVSTPFLFDLADPFTKNGNDQLIRASIEWLTGSPLTTVETQANAMVSNTLTVPANAFAVWFVILIIILPVAALSIGLIRRHLRKNR